MQLTAERRQLLEGDEGRARRNLPRLNFGDAASAPDWAQLRIIQIRSAIVEKRAIPAASRSFIAGCEQRSLAKRQADPVVKRDDELEALKTKAHSQGQRIIADFRLAGLPLTASERSEESRRRRETVLAMAEEIRRIAAAAGAL